MVLNAQLAGYGDPFLLEVVSGEVIASDDAELNHHLFLWELPKQHTLIHIIYIYQYYQNNKFLKKTKLYIILNSNATSEEILF